MQLAQAFALSHHLHHKQKRKFQYFVSKKAYDIEGLGPRIVDQLMEKNLISSFDDIFTLKKGDLLELEGFAEKSADNLLREIEDRKVIELRRFLISLSIDQVGEETAYDLEEYFGVLKNIQNASKEELENIGGDLDGLRFILNEFIWQILYQPESVKVGGGMIVDSLAPVSYTQLTPPASAPG